MPHGNAKTKTYLVEHYQPGLDPEGLQAYATRVQTAADALRQEGARVRSLRCTILPGDEALLCLFEAESEQLVRAIYTRAALGFDRISEAISLDDPHPASRANTKEIPR